MISPQLDLFLGCKGWLTRICAGPYCIVSQDRCPEPVWCRFCDEAPEVLVSATVREGTACLCDIEVTA